MQGKTVTLDGVKYEINVIGMEDGFELLDEDGAGINAPMMIRAAVRINGKMPERNEIPFGHAQKLFPMVMEINGIRPDEGNE